MKKLLALILCVMMFVAVIPTAAFAVTVPTTAAFPISSGYQPVWKAKNVAEDAVDAAADNIMALYQTLAADNGVFATVSAIDGVVSGIAKELWKDVDEANFGGIKLSAEAAEKATKNAFRDIIGNEIMKYMDDHYTSFASKQDDGSFKINPMKYMEAFATAASKAVSSDKAVANIQAVVMALAAAKQMNEFMDGTNDLYSEIIAWNDAKGADVWATYFGQDIAPIPWLPYALYEPTVDGKTQSVDTSDYSYVGEWIVSHS